MPLREVYQALFKFVFVRNSGIYRLARIIILNVSDPPLREANESFSAFLRRKLDSEREWQYRIDTAITPQRNYLVDLRGNQIIDSMCRYESLRRLRSLL